MSSEPESQRSDDYRLQQPYASLASDERRRVLLRRNKALATGLLGVMGATYAGTYFVPQPGLVTHFIRAGAEAGVVGGLADWFAVTALFRKPLGLPIPHTGIIPANQARIGEALSRFVEQNFLTRTLVVSKVREAQLGRSLAEWLAAPATGAAIAGWTVTAIPVIIRALGRTDLREFADRAIGTQLQRADLAPGIGKLLQILAGSGEADALFEVTIEQALRWLEENKQRVYTLVRERSRWWIPKRVDQRIATAILDAVTDLFHALQDPEGEARLKFRAALKEFIEEMIESPDRRKQINETKSRLLSNPEVKAWLSSVWREVTQSALRDLEKPAPALQRTLEETISSIGRTLSQDEAMIAHLDTAAERLALALVQRRSDIASVISEVVRSWDTRTLTGRLELAVGSDLQYIRMNGTLVGAGVGCVLFMLTRLFGLEG